MLLLPFVEELKNSPGDDPPRDRTGELRKLGFPTRHLGNVQMTTDTALGVTKIVVQDKSTFINIDQLFMITVFSPYS